MTDRPLRDVLESQAERLMSLPGVTGVAEGETGDGTPCLLVLVVKKTASLAATIPPRLEGHPVEICETGELEAREDADA